ncbi:MAG: deoxyhypusine synthase [Prosthecochloris sp.]|nr:deoxyhypusine synthase [Prosthecochloris sp.]
MKSDVRKEELLREVVEHIDIKALDVVPLVEQMGRTAFQARNLARAASIMDMMQRDRECAVILTLAGSLVSAGLKQVIVDMIEHNMVDVIVSTGANIVDQDFFEALGFRHYKGDPFADDGVLRELHIDRIYDTYIDEDDLRVCDETMSRIAAGMKPGAYSSREFIMEMGRYIDTHDLDRNSIVYKAYEKGVPIFVPAFSDCSAGFGLVHQQWNNPQKQIAIDSVKDFRELTRIKIENDRTGIVMLGGGVPKNFTQDIVVAAEVLGYEDVSMHTYAVQVTVADERDGGLSGSTLKEASSWGKVDTVYEQMVFSEATVALPLLAGYAYHKQGWTSREPKNFNELLDREPVGS